MLPRVEPFKLAPRLAAAIRSATTGATPIATFGFDEPSLNYYCDRSLIERIASGTVGFSNISASIQMILAIAIAGHYLSARWWQLAQDKFAAAPFYAQAAALMLLMIGIQYVAATGAAPFIYTKF